MRLAYRLVAAGCVAGACLAACGDASLRGDSDDNRNESLDDAPPAAGTGGSPADQLCAPGAILDCYSGPPETRDVGLCRAGQQVCGADGSWGACQGEVLPSEEVCATQGDDDCDGQPNEGGPDCSCNPGAAVECYSGPTETKNVGTCEPGAQICNDEGDGYGPCDGEVLPDAEDCASAEDEDCDGETPPCPDAIVDLRADNNRNGTVELTVASEDANEDSWDDSHGAVFLANIDDDEGDCPTSGSDSALAACHDAADTVVNGSDDLTDLARLKTVPWPDAPSDATGSVTVTSSSYVRLFKKNGASFSLYTSGAALSQSDLVNGVEFAIEAKDIVRSGAWSGFVNVTFTVNGGTGPAGPIGTASDQVRMRVAPLLFRHHLDEVESYYVTNLNYQSSIDFRNDLDDAAAAAGVGAAVDVYYDDQWTQDFFETAYMSMPKAGGGQHVVHVNVRSPNYDSGGLREAGRVVFDLRGENVAALVEYDSGHPNAMDSLNSFGNFETIPPFSHGGQQWPLGRVLRGSTTDFYPDADFDLLVNSQGVQDSVYIDTSWLLVGHVDETVSFVKANTPRGWVMPVNDAALAKTMLQQQQAAGNGTKTLFTGKYWSGGTSAQRTINAVLADTEIMDESAWAAVYVDEQEDVLEQATGLTDAEKIAVPFLHWESSGYSVAYQPGTVNMLVLSDEHIAAADPYGPIVASQDVFKTQMQQAFSTHGITVHWIENWDLYHRLLGEVHCGTNVTRKVPSSQWWESGL